MKATWRRKGFFYLKTLRSHSIAKESQDRNLESGTEAEAMKEWCCPVYFHALFDLLSYTGQGYLSRGGTTHSKLGPSISIIIQKNTPQIFPVGQAYEGIFLIKIPFLQICVKLTKTNQHTF